MRRVHYERLTKRQKQRRGRLRQSLADKALNQKRNRNG